MKRKVIWVFIESMEMQFYVNRIKVSFKRSQTTMYKIVNDFVDITRAKKT